MSAYLSDEKFNRFKLTEEEFLNVENNIIKYFGKADTCSNPTLYLIGGEPGCGKTGIEKLIVKENSNCVVCNSDNLRDFHSKMQLLKKHCAEAYVEISAFYAQKWNQKLIQFCKENKYNVLIETTFRDYKIIKKTYEDFKKEGYKIEIHLMSVNKYLSKLGIYKRYEDQIQSEGFGRKVSVEDYESRYESVLPTLKKVHELKLYDEIFLYTRSILESKAVNNIKKIDVAKELAKLNKFKSVKVRGQFTLLKLFLHFRNKNLNLIEQRALNKRFFDILRMMKNRNAPKEEKYIYLEHFPEFNIAKKY